MTDTAELVGTIAYAFICIGVWVVGSWRKAGWTVGLLGNVLLVVYGGFSGQEGFLLLPIVSAAAQVHHLVRWRHESWRRQRPKPRTVLERQPTRRSSAVASHRG